MISVTRVIHLAAESYVPEGWKNPKEEIAAVVAAQRASHG